MFLDSIITYFVFYIVTNIRRYFQPDDTIFLTHVTFNRLPILIEYYDAFWKAVKKQQSKMNFDIIARVILPDHFHMLISAGENDISALMKKIKLSFSMKYRQLAGKRNGRVWQYRFWDHIIRNQDDLNRHIDYIHYNPVKHGLVKNPQDWEYSSFKEYLKKGYYSVGWGINNSIEISGEFGE